MLDEGLERLARHPIPLDHDLRLVRAEPLLLGGAGRHKADPDRGPRLRAAIAGALLQFAELPADEYTDLAHEAGRNVTALVRCLPRLSLDSIMELTAAPAQGESTWMSGMTGDLEPLADVLQMILETAPAKSKRPADSKAS